MICLVDFVCILDLLEGDDVSHAQELVNCLQVLQVVALALHSSLHSQVFLSYFHSSVDSYLKYLHLMVTSWPLWSVERHGTLNLHIFDVSIVIDWVLTSES